MIPGLREIWMSTSGLKILVDKTKKRDKPDFYLLNIFIWYRI
jgi:hypothetical protein